ncbi:hypothetical protein QPK87_12075 [Kamptonema cortianum]|nr:hypothetical protein [Kamptonema cortianum]
METVISIGLAILAWIFPEPLKKLSKSNKKQDDPQRELQFFIRLGEQSYPYWEEVEEPVRPSFISPFSEDSTQFFEIARNDFARDVDPIFDITILSDLSSTALIHQLGIEIVSIAQEMRGYGSIQAAKVLPQEFYIIEIPDIRTNLQREFGIFPRSLAPRNISLLLTVPQSDIFKLDVGSTFRYELLLKNYVDHMPNFALLRFWIKTQNKTYYSRLIHIFTL